MSSLLDKNNDIIEGLQKIGLNKNDSLVYISLLKLGEVGTSKISRDTGLHGQTIYNSLDSLEKNNLINHSTVRGRKKFAAQNPSILLDIAERQKDIAGSVIESINAKYSVLENGSIEIMKGRESLVSVELRMLKEMEAGKTISILGGTGDSFVSSMGNSIREYDYQRLKKNISVKYIGSTNQTDYLHTMSDTRGKFSGRRIPQALSGLTNVSIYENLGILMYIFDQDTVTSIVIRNKKIAESYKGFFDGLWDMGK